MTVTADRLGGPDVGSPVREDATPAPAQARAAGGVLVEQAGTLFELPEPRTGWRALIRRQHLMHHNRLAALLGFANLVVLGYAAGPGGWWTGSVDLRAMTTMVLINLAVATLIRQQHVINVLFWLATRPPTTWPLAIRATCGKVYHFGGLHVGGTVAATGWFVVFTVSMTAGMATGPVVVSWPVLVLSYVIMLLLIGMVVSAIPGRRARKHDQFERIHRFAGWTVLILFWIHAALVAAKEPGPFARTAEFWVLVIVTVSIALPWLRLRRVPVDITTPSTHVAIARFDYGVTPFAGSSTALSRNPLLEWHHFANVPAPSQHGFRLTISRSGDWTGRLIDDKPSHLWVKGTPCAGVGNIDQLFTRVIWVATGSGIGPCLPHLLTGDTPSRLVWSTRNPRRTYGDELVDEILEVQPQAVVWDTDSSGKPDLVRLAYQAYREFDAEAVICISNKKTTWHVVEEMEIRGIPAYGAIWDS